MGIFKRVSDIVSANLNDLVDRFESPEAMLRQAIREMVAAISRTMEATACAIADERQIEHELARRREQSTELLARARAAVVCSDDSAARSLLARRQEQETLVAALDDQLVKVRSTTGKVRRQLDAMRVRQVEAQRTLHVLIARDRAATVRRELAIQQESFAGSVTGLSRFIQMREKIEHREAEVDALVELAAGGEVAAPGDHDVDVESQFQAMKAEVAAAESQR